eukprot:977847-Alexandrium_andersonii.AAC.1
MPSSARSTWHSAGRVNSSASSLPLDGASRSGCSISSAGAAGAREAGASPGVAAALPRRQ